MDMFAAPPAWEIEHVSWADWAQLIVIAPATANVIGKIAQGLSDDSLTCLVMASRAPIVVAPAMNDKMLCSPTTQANLVRLRSLGYRIVEPGQGFLACGTEGKGRLADLADIVAAVESELAMTQDLAGARMVVTAGPTREPIDPVRFISNPSTGRMGYALAAVARRRGAEVTLVSGPTELPDPPGVEVVRVQTAVEMRDRVVALAETADIIIGAAAPADFAPAQAASSKTPKAQVPDELALTPTPDILRELGERQGRTLLVGFAAETDHLLEHAAEKLQRKHLDLIVANDVSAPGIGFAGNDNAGVLLFADGARREIPRMSKEAMAAEICSAVAELWRARSPGKS
jgi:phosphopantothenoylcysteine decarboxylase/phosphopantothenate--cysteine ligase